MIDKHARAEQHALNKIAANNAERFVQRELMLLGMSSELRGGSSEHDLIVNGNVSVEVKSANGANRRTGEKHERIIGRFGRFDLRQETQRKKLHETNRWICFVLYAARKHRIIGFLQGNKIIVSRRYITMASLLDENGLLNEHEFVEVLERT